MIGAKKKKLPPKVENMSKEEILVFLKKKRECEAAAQKIVISLLENAISEANFVECLQFIGQSHYEDVTEERAIIKKCGYPVCVKTLPDNLPTQQYKISFKTNRVFDITARKRFCSNGCYKASVFIKEQILTSPLWCRDKDDIPKFKLLPPNTKGALGEEIDLSLVKKVNVDETKDSSFRSLLDFTEASLTELSSDDVGKNVVIESVEIANNEDNIRTNIEIEKSVIYSSEAVNTNSNLESNSDVNRENVIVNSNLENHSNVNKEIVSSNPNLENDVIGFLNSNSENRSDVNREINNSNLELDSNASEQYVNLNLKNTAKDIYISEHEKTKMASAVIVKDDGLDKSKDKKISAGKTKKNTPSSSIIGDVVERMSENRVDPMISEGQKLKEKIESRVKLKEMKKDKKVRQPLFLAIVHIERCLGEWFTLETMLFLFGEERVKQMVSDKGDSIKEYLNNMANGLFYKSTSYDQYKQLCRKLNLLELEDRRYDSKVASAKELKPLPHYSMLQEESKTLDIKVRAFFKGELEVPISANKEIAAKDVNLNQNEERDVTNLPLVDKTAQMALRRKIVLTALNKVLPDLLQTLGIPRREISGEVKLLVSTLNLQAHNIIFKLAQWNMIAMIFVKLLAIKDYQLKRCLDVDRANRHLQLLLMSYEQDGGYLDRLISWLTDVDRLLDSNDTQLTIGKLKT